MRYLMLIVLGLFSLLPAYGQSKAGINWEQYFVTGSLSVGAGAKDYYPHPSLLLQVGKDTATKGIRSAWVADTSAIPYPRKFGLEVSSWKDTCHYTWLGNRWQGYKLTVSYATAAALQDSSALLRRTKVDTGSNSYIKNQYAGAQSASLWISGNVRTEGTSIRLGEGTAIAYIGSGGGASAPVLHFSDDNNYIKRVVWENSLRIGASRNIGFDMGDVFFNGGKVAIGTTVFNGAALQITGGLLSLPALTAGPDIINGSVFYNSSTNQFVGARGSIYRNFLMDADTIGLAAKSVMNQITAVQAAGFSITGPAYVQGSTVLGQGTAGGSALLTVSSTSKGVLLCRMTTLQRDAIPAPDEGLIIYNLDTHLFNFFNGTVWKEISSL